MIMTSHLPPSLAIVLNLSNLATYFNPEHSIVTFTTGFSAFNFVFASF